MYCNSYPGYSWVSQEGSLRSALVDSCGFYSVRWVEITDWAGAGQDAHRFEQSTDLFLLDIDTENWYEVDNNYVNIIMCQTQYQTVYANRQTHPPSISMVFYEHRSLIYGSRIVFGSTKLVVIDAWGLVDQ